MAFSPTASDGGKLAQIQQCLQAQAEQEVMKPIAHDTLSMTMPATDKPPHCPRCKTGNMIIVGEIMPTRSGYG